MSFILQGREKPSALPSSSALQRPPLLLPPPPHTVSPFSSYYSPSFSLSRIPSILFLLPFRPPHPHKDDFKKAWEIILSGVPFSGIPKTPETISKYSFFSEASQNYKFLAGYVKFELSDFSGAKILIESAISGLAPGNSCVVSEINFREVPKFFPQALNLLGIIYSMEVREGGGREGGGKEGGREGEREGFWKK
jgi:hypothetical protein